MLRALILPFLAFSLAGCVTASPLDMERPSGEWALEQVQGAPAGAPTPTITFESGRIAGFAGCNRYFGQVQQDPNVAAYFGAIGSTRMACPGPAMQMEALFLGKLSDTRAVRVIDGRLVFFGEEDSEIMRFAPAPGSD